MTKKVFDILIWLGIFLILFLSPLMMGSVHIESFSVIFFIISITFFIFLLRAFLAGELKIKKTGIEFIFFFLILYSVMQLFFNSIYRYATLNATLKLFSYLLFFILIANFITTKKDVTKLLWIIAFSGAVISIFGLIQRVSGDNIFNLAGMNIEKQPYATFINRNHFAAFIEIAFSLTLCLLAYKLSLIKIKAKNGLGTLTKLAENGSLFIFIILALMLSSVFLSLSRAGVLFLLLGIIIFYIFYLSDTKTFATRSTLLTLLGLGVFFALILITSLNLDLIVDRFINLDTIKLRLNVYLATIIMFLSYPLLGTGLGTFQYIFPKYQLPFPNQFYFSHAHNDYLEFMSEAGAIGIIIFAVGAFIYLKKIGFLKELFNLNDRFEKFLKYGALTAVILISLHSLIGFSLHMPSIMIYFITSLAILIFSSAKDYIITLNSRKLIFMLILPIYLIISLPLARIQSDILSAKNILKDKSFDILYRYRIASSKDPLNAEYKYKISKILLERAYEKKDRLYRKKLIEESFFNAKEASRLAPTNPFYLYSVARILVIAGNYDQAEEFFDRAISYAPSSVKLRTSHAIVCFNISYRSRDSNVKKLFFKKGIEEIKKVKQIFPKLSLENYRKYFKNYDKQSKEIKEAF